MRIILRSLRSMVPPTLTDIKASSRVSLLSSSHLLNIFTARMWWAMLNTE
ncbi:MAG: hypothetical protein ACP5I8_02265 [Phycisphaerae bacterium]